jgi:hypothetical protein
LRTTADALKFKEHIENAADLRQGHSIRQGSQMSQDHDFAFEIEPLPADEHVSLADAMQFLRYGGIPRIRPSGGSQFPHIGEGALSLAKEGHYRFRPEGSEVVLRGPHIGALLGAATDTKPDPQALKSVEDRQQRRLARYETAKIEFAEAMERHEEAVQAHRQWENEKAEHVRQIACWEAGGKVGPQPKCPNEPAVPNRPMAPTRPQDVSVKSIPTTWQAEVDRREAELQAALNEAARAGRLRLWGVQVDEPLNDEMSPDDPGPDLDTIPANYFRFGPASDGSNDRHRYFDSETGRIHAIPLHLPEVADREIRDYADNPTTGARFRSYSNVLVSQANVLALAKQFEQPARLSKEKARTILQEEKDRRSAKGEQRPISQEQGLEILRQIDPQFSRDAAREITKSVTGNEKRGPTGPRRNSAANSAEEK